jgi:ATP-dependent exoDNAse (exonuclease V) beta subunit
MGSSPRAFIKLSKEAIVFQRPEFKRMETLPKAQNTLPEFSFVTSEGVKRLDLLRDLGGDEYEIVDFKTDEEPGDVKAKHGEQLAGYANALREYLQQRGKPARKVRTLVCLTAPSLPDTQRLVEITA